MRDSSRTRARVGRRSAAGRYAALPLAALAAAALHARSHHLGPGSVGPTRSAEPGADPGPELAAFGVEDYEPGTPVPLP